MKIEKKILFGLPIYSVKVNPNSYDKKSFLKIVNKNYSIDNYRNKFDDSKSNLHHSYFDETNDKFIKVNYKEIGLLDVYNKIFQDFFYITLKLKDNFLWKFTIENYTASMENQFLRPHNHLPHCDFATVHYVQFDSTKHRRTEFFNHNDFSPYIGDIRKTLCNVLDKLEPNNSYLFQNWSFDSVEDEMIIFPSCLKHEVPKCENSVDKLRVTISCNLTLNNVVGEN